MSPTIQPPIALASAAALGLVCGVAVGYGMRAEVDDIAPDAILYYDSEEDPAWSYE